jgi:hypothetical protein
MSIIAHEPRAQSFQDRDAAARVERGFAGFAGHTYLRLTTFRRNGLPVNTAVWFVLENNSLYVWTASDSGKVKRIRRHPEVLVAPSTHNGSPRGPVVEGKVRFLAADEEERVQRAFELKYGWLRSFFALLWRVRRKQHIYLEITPAPDALA